MYAWARVFSVPVPQTILTRKTKSAIFLVFTIDDGGGDAVRAALEDIPGLNNAVSSRAPEAALAGIVSIGSAAWDRLFTGPRPRSLRPFVPYEGEVHTAPATPADLLVHIKSDDMGLCYELGAKITEAFGDAVTVVDEVHGFRYFDLRDLIGFVDGTENPIGQAAIDAITVGGEDPDFEGGSYVAIQRYVHDLSSWNDLSTEEQEAAIGRTKLDNVEMADDVKPPNSHIALNVVEDENGEEIDVVRDNMPYGDVSGAGVNGTFYIAYSAAPERHRGDAAQDVHRRPARHLRPPPRLHHRGHRGPVLHPDTRLPRRPATRARRRTHRVPDPDDPFRRLAGHRVTALTTPAIRPPHPPQSGRTRRTP